MGEDEKTEIINQLYDAIEDNFVEVSLGSNISDYNGHIREALSMARDVGAVWRDFYDIHEERIEEGKRAYVSKLRREGLSLKLLKDKDEIYVVGFNESIARSKTVGEFFDDLMKKDIDLVNSFKISKKFPEDKKIGLEDIFGTLTYFEDNLGY